MKNSTVIEVIVVTAIVVISTFLLTITHTYTKPVIEENEQKEFNKKLKKLFPETNHTKELSGKCYEVYDKNQNRLGHAVITESYGYQSEIRLLVGYKDNQTISSVVILNQEETPGVGSKVEEQSFLSQFKGVSKDEFNNIDAISGATISSEAVVEAAKDSFEELEC
ncbi:MAG: FMN-binding protein [Nanoarchaeota archaeon]